MTLLKIIAIAWPAATVINIQKTVIRIQLIPDLYINGCFFSLRQLILATPLRALYCYRLDKEHSVHPVWIRVRIGPHFSEPRALACRTSRLNGAVFRMRPQKTRPRVEEDEGRLISLPSRRLQAPIASSTLYVATLHQQ